MTGPDDHDGGRPIPLTNRGKRIGVIVGSETFDRLIETADDIEDRLELAAARAEDEYVPWDEVKADLGLG